MSDSSDGDARDLPYAVLASIAGGLGGLAFFTFVGGAVLVARFRGAGLSGTKSVALVPKADLLASGGQTLVIPVIAGVAVLVVFLPVARYPCSRGLFLTWLGLAGLVVGAVMLSLYWWPWDWGGDEWEVGAALPIVALAGGLAVNHLAKPAELDRQDREPPASRRNAATLLFLVVVLFGALISYGVGYAHPVVHPAAVLLAGDKNAIPGIYVGEDADEVWIAAISPEVKGVRAPRDSGEIVAFPRDDVSRLVVGDHFMLGDAVKRARCLAGWLEAQHRENVASKCLETP